MSDTGNIIQLPRPKAARSAAPCGSFAMRNVARAARLLALSCSPLFAPNPSSSVPVSDTLQITDIPVEGYERVVRGVDPESGLHALISVHDTTLGPALGGLRMWPYGSEEEALFDVKRLSRGMTYKSAVAKTGLGGGKAVILGDPKKVKSEALYLAMGRHLRL